MLRAWAIVRGRCLEGRVWRPATAASSQSETGQAAGEGEAEPYWTGAMVASYALGVPVLGLFFFAVLLATGWDVLLVLLVADVLFIAVAPFIWRYSRVMWLHLDWLIDPVR